MPTCPLSYQYHTTRATAYIIQILQVLPYQHVLQPILYKYYTCYHTARATAYIIQILYVLPYSTCYRLRYTNITRATIQHVLQTTLYKYYTCYHTTRATDYVIQILHVLPYSTCYRLRYTNITRAMKYLAHVFRYTRLILQ